MTSTTARWLCSRTPENKLYWCELHTGEKSWLEPLSRPPHILVERLPPMEASEGWRAYRTQDKNKSLFFLNVMTGERQWHRPRGFDDMPAGEDFPTSSVWVRYGGSDTPYWYCPATKMKTTLEPHLPDRVVSEEEAFATTTTTMEETNDNDSVSSFSSSSSSSKEHQGEKPVDPEIVSNFNRMLSLKGVNHVSRWENWITKLSVDPDFNHMPMEQRRKHFEMFVRSLATHVEENRTSLLKAAKKRVQEWWTSDRAFSSPDEAFKAAWMDCRDALTPLQESERRSLINAQFQKRQRLRR